MRSRPHQSPSAIAKLEVSFSLVAMKRLTWISTLSIITLSIATPAFAQTATIAASDTPIVE
ncbi:MAG: hypothetical protein F6K28_34090 [Microcoleus sp. SIO2G3]|nr:hypothetical protein [Microcoleus sp. SIO2G3]